MTRRFNGKSLVDEIAARLWDTSSSFQAKIIGWINEIQDDLAGELPLDYYKFELKKLLPTDQEIIDLSPQIPSAPTTALNTGGSLTEGSVYRAYISFLIYDGDTQNYIESEASPAGTARTATATDKTIDLSDIDTYDGDTSMEPTTIYRRVYLSVDGGEPLYIADITDNTTTTYSITAESSSTVTPVSDSEVERITSDHPRFTSDGKVLFKIDRSQALRFNPTGSNSDTPDSFDYVGTRKIYLYPKLGTSATTAQRTLKYTVYRRPHEVFYDVDRKIDMPIQAKKALIEGVVWKGYEYRDRDKDQTKLGNYEKFKAEFARKMNRQQGAPSAVRDVNGDWAGFEV